MSKSKELAKNTAILFIGTFFTKIISYLLLPLYTAYLSTAEYGTVELFNTIVSLLLPIVGLQVDAGVFRFLIKYRDNEDNKEKIISTTFIFILCSIFVYFIVFIFVSFFINNQYKWLVLLNLLFATISSYIQQVSRGIGKNNDYSISSIVIAIARVIVTVVLLVGVHLKVDAMLYGGCTAYLAGIIYLIIRLRLFDYIKINQINKESLKEVLSYSLPMIPNALSWWIFSSSDRIIISRFVGLDATGILSIGYKFSNIIVVIYSVFNMSLSESIALHIDDEDISDYFNKTYNFVSNIFTSVGIGLLAFMPIAFPILINSNFNEAYITPSVAANTCNTADNTVNGIRLYASLKLELIRIGNAIGINANKPIPTEVNILDTKLYVLLK